MPTLYERANNRQYRLLRIVAGSCRDAANSHPKWQFDERFVTSIAKRAVGTLTAEWPSVLAVPLVVRSESDGRARAKSASRLGGEDQRRAGGTSYSGWRSPLARLHKAVGLKAGEARRAGQTERLEALIEVLRMLAAAIEVTRS